MARWRRMERIGNKLIRFGKRTIHGSEAAKNIVARVPVYEKKETIVEIRKFTNLPLKTMFEATEDTLTEIKESFDRSYAKDYVLTNVDTPVEATWWPYDNDIRASAHPTFYVIGKRKSDGRAKILFWVNCSAEIDLGGELKYIGCTAGALPSISVETVLNVQFEPIDDKDFEGALK